MTFPATLHELPLKKRGFVEDLDDSELSSVIEFPTNNARSVEWIVVAGCRGLVQQAVDEDRKSTRLNSSHLGISYAVFCLKKKNLLVDVDRHHQRPTSPAGTAQPEGPDRLGLLLHPRPHQPSDHAIHALRHRGAHMAGGGR